MKLKYFFLLALVAGSFTPVSAQTSAIPHVVMAAIKKAANENKNVFVMFHASWCGWCHKMDSSMNDVSCKALFESNYVTCHLTVDESKDKKNLETPGAVEYRKQFHGEEQGLPFWLILDKQGKLLADSRMPVAGTDKDGQNTGCPAAKEEVDYFISVLQKTSKLNDAQLKTIEQRFIKNQ